MEIETRDMSNLADLLDPPGFRDPTRFHVTELISAVENIGKEVKPFDYDGLPDHVKNIMSMGRIWEHLVLRDVIGEAAREGFVAVPKLTLEVEGVIGSLDAALFFNETIPVNRRRAWAVVEMKARFSPPKDDFPQGHQRYMRQCKAYCYMTGARKVWMPIVYYSSGPPNVQYLIHRFEFTDLEVQENWQMLINMKEHLEKKKAEEEEKVNDLFKGRTI